MVDITKCTGENCPLKDKCYRYTIPLGEWQSYTNFQYNHDKKDCEFFIEKHGKLLIVKR